ncbi:MAG: DUF1016 N-terminal domain-containing protein [Deltaproteobacteria bacterium]|nr:DUF1016 N-terminal domain-containing protein [Deltaproteobacteria bacterium]
MRAITALYSNLLKEIKTRIRQGQTRAIWSVNAELIATYWDVGRMLCKCQVKAGWGAGVLPRLSRDLHNELPEVKGFSVRNLKLMTQFYREYSSVPLIGQQSVAQLDKSHQAPKGQHVVAQLPWGHNVLLMQRIKDKAVGKGKPSKREDLITGFQECKLGDISNILQELKREGKIAFHGPSKSGYWRAS